MNRTFFQRPLNVSIYLLLLALPLAAMTGIQAAEESQQASNVKINIGKLSHGIKLHLDKIRQSSDQEISVLDELELIDSKFKQKKDKIKVLEKRLQAQVKLLALKDEELRTAEITRNNLLKHLQKRLRSFYQMGKTGILNVTFSNKNLPELMLFTDSFKQMIYYDQSVFEAYRDSMAELQRRKHAHELEKTLLQDFIRQAEDEKKNLQALRLEKEKLLARIKTQKGLYELALKEMRKAEADLGQTLARIKHKEDVRKRGFLLNKGNLPLPVTGRLALRFGERASEGLDRGEKNKGITIATDGDASVYAVYKGNVVFAGYRRGFGNMVIIDHGYNYFTVTSRLDTILVKEGDNVAQGAMIGSTGDMATLFAQGLYFEIRHGSTQLDPVEWLQDGFTDG